MRASSRVIAVAVAGTVAGIAVALHAGTALAQQSIDTMSYGIAKDDFRETVAIKASVAVCQNLRDCDSAKFVVMVVHRLGKLPDGQFAAGNNGYSVCGTVNAKNGFGGYSGDARYISATATWKRVFSTMAPGGFYLVDDDPSTSASFQKVWQTYCW